MSKITLDVARKSKKFIEDIKIELRDHCVFVENKLINGIEESCDDHVLSFKQAMINYNKLQNAVVVMLSEYEDDISKIIKELQDDSPEDPIKTL